jgi:HK97 family phage portal protein
MKLFGLNITRAKKTDEPNTAGERTISNVYLTPWEQGRELDTQINFDALIKAYQSWVYVCASKNSQAVANAKLKLYVGKQSKEQKLIVRTKAIAPENNVRLRAIAGLDTFTRKAVELEEVVDHPFLEMIRNVNPIINRFDLWELTELFLEMTGNSYWYVVKGKLNAPEQIWLVPSQGMKIVVGKGNLIGGYVYTSGMTKVPFPTEEIIHFKFPSLTSQLYGSGPMQAIMDAYVFDKSVKGFETTLMKNMGRPEGVLQTDVLISDAEFVRLQERWRQNYGGAGKIGKTLILEKGLKYQPITMSPKEINYIYGRKLAREEIAAAFGVPISKLTTEQVNLSNAKIGEYQYMADTIEPRLRRIEEKLNEKLMPLYGNDDKLFVAYDTVIPSDDDFKLRERTTNLGTCYSSINMEREKNGESPVEWGDKPLQLMQQPAGMEGLAGGLASLLQPRPDENPTTGVKPTNESASGGRGKVTATPGLSQSKKDIDALVDAIVMQLKGDADVRANA